MNEIPHFLKNQISGFETNQEPIKLISTSYGHLLIFLKDKVIASSLINRGTFQEDKILQITNFLQKKYAFNPASFVDVGANIGTHTIFALKKAGFTDAVAIEAEPRNFQLLLCNLIINNLSSSVELFNCAVSEKNGSLEFELSKDNYGDHRVRVANANPQKTFDENQRKVFLVPAKTLSDILAQTTIDFSRTLIWIDVQGHEGQVLAGFKTLSQQKNKPFIVTEFFPYGLDRAGKKEAYFKFLRSCSQIFDINKDNWEESDGLNVDDLYRAYDTMLQSTKESYHPNTDLLCVLKEQQKYGNIKVPNFLIANASPMTENERVAMTISCRDTDYIPKVPRAGKILTTPEGKVQIMHNGLKVVAGGYIGDLTTNIITGLKGHHEPQEEKAFSEVLTHLSPGATMIELGTNWAYYSLWFNKQIKNAQNICLEPNPQFLALGKKNAQLNAASNITFIQNASGDIDRSIVKLRLETNPLAKTSIPVRTVDGIVEEYQLEKVDLLHMDIQGAELAALRGAIQTIQAKKLRFVFVSTHHYSISQDLDIHQKCLDFISGLGGHIICSHTIKESFSGDGLIVASFYEKDKNFSVKISANHNASSLFRPLKKDLALTFQRYHQDCKKIDEQQKQITQLAASLKTKSAELALIKDDFSWKLSFPIRFVWKRIKKIYNLLPYANCRLGQWLFKATTNKKCIYLNLTATTQQIKEGVFAGIQRLCFEATLALLKNNNDQQQIIPVIVKAIPHYGTVLQAIKIYKNSQGKPCFIKKNIFPTLKNNDVFCEIETPISTTHTDQLKDFFEKRKERSFKKIFVICDIFPLLYSQNFGKEFVDFFQDYMRHTVYCYADQIIGISEKTKKDVAKLFAQYSPPRSNPPKISSLLLANSLDPSKKLQRTKISPSLISLFRNKKIILSVSSIEPRKGYLDLIEAFTNYLSSHEDTPLHLCIIGKYGFNNSQIKDAMEELEQKGKLTWIKNATDHDLRFAYKKATAFVSASHDEGFGLPVVEASQFHIPLILRDIEIFHEICGENAQYFSNLEELSSIFQALEKGEIPRSQWQYDRTWDDYAQDFLTQCQN